jgi:cytochrome b involved in lipid metabolism
VNHIISSHWFCWHIPIVYKGSEFRANLQYKSCTWPSELLYMRKLFLTNTWLFILQNKQNLAKTKSRYSLSTTPVIPPVCNFHQPPQSYFWTFPKPTMCPWCLSLFLGSYSKPTSQPPAKDYRVITKQEVALHTTPSSLWVIMWGKVYDFTSLQSHHPGGHEGKSIVSRNLFIANMSKSFKSTVERTLPSYFTTITGALNSTPRGWRNTALEFWRTPTY